MDDNDKIRGWRMMVIWVGLWVASWLGVVGIVWLGIRIVRALSG
jgi:hypothetical protein